MDENRLRHSLAVGRKMVKIGKMQGFDDDELQELFILGYNHDIGYEFGENINHAKIGGEVLKNSGYKYWREVYYHGDINSSYESSFLDILNLADMQIDKDGREVGFGKRLEDIGKRYGFKSDVYVSASILIEKLKELK